MPRRRSHPPPPLSLVAAAPAPSEVVPPPPPGPWSRASVAPECETSDQVAPLLDVADLARILAVTPAAVYALVARGHLPRECVFRVGRLLRFKRDQVEAWLGSHGRNEKTP